MAPATGGSGNWDTSDTFWASGNPSGTLVPWPTTGNNNDAYLGGTAGTLTLTTGIAVNDISVAPSPSGNYTITGAGQILTLNGAAQSVINVATGSQLIISSGLTGINGFTLGNSTSPGNGTLILDTSVGNNTLFGNVTVNGGTLQLGSTASGDQASSQALRSDSLSLASGTSLTSGVPSSGGTSDIRVGSLSGSGSITPGSNGAINELAGGNSTFSGTITTSGGLNLRGDNGTTQIFNGNLTGLTGTIGINSGVTMTLSGTGDSVSGVLGASTGSATNIALRGGGFVLDNSGGNTNATNGRLSSGTVVTTLGGTLSLIGSSTGTSQSLGNLTLNAGAATINVTSNSSSNPTTLSFANSGNFSLRASTMMTVNFVGTGGTLGAGGNNPTIKFAGNPYTGNNTSLLANSAGSDTTIGFATVTTGGDTNWAGYSATTGIIPLSNTAQDQTNLGSATTTERVGYVPTGNYALSGNLSVGVLKITPGATGLNLNLGTNNLASPAVMLTGNNSFSITGSTGYLFTSTGTSYLYAINPNTTLNVGVGIAGANHPTTISGAGFVNLNGSSNQLNFSAVENVNILGTLRGTTTTLGGGTSSGGAFTNLNLLGGVLEISGGGTFSRALTNINGTAAGGTLDFNTNGTSRGDGGFSAIGGNATVTLVTSIGGSTPAPLTWNASGNQAGAFLQNGYALLLGSTQSDSTINLTDNIGLDDGTLTNSYFAREVRVIGNPNSSTELAQLSGNITGSPNADLLKTGTGPLELTSSNNTYAGNTLIQQGTLRANNGFSSTGAGGGVTTGTGNGTATGTGNVFVSGGARLGGYGGLSGSVTLAASGAAEGGGAITAGADDSHTGLLKTGAQTWNNGAVYNWKIGTLGTTASATSGGSGTAGQTSSSWDELLMSGLNLSSLSSANPFTIKLANVGTLTNTYNNPTQFSWDIAQVTGSGGSSTLTAYAGYPGDGNNLIGNGFALDTTNFTVDGVTNPGSSVGTFSLEFEPVGSGAEDLVLDYYDATPEPGTALLIMAGGMPLLLARRRRERGQKAASLGDTSA
jgi:hypothetical protein